MNLVFCAGPQESDRGLAFAACLRQGDSDPQYSGLSFLEMLAWEVKLQIHENISCVDL
jgi:hypothetical protein